MRILHVLNSNKYSGAENVVCQIIKMFADDPGYEMAYCSRDGEIRRVVESKGMRFLPIGDLSKSEIKRIIDEYKPDIIHAHDFRASMACARFSKSTPVISHLHNNAPWLKRFGLKSIAYGSSCKKYAKILTVSNSVFDEFIFGKRFANKELCVGNPIDVQSIRAVGDVDNRELKYDVCFCGRLVEQKNPEFFVEVIAALPQTVKAIMIGDGDLKDAVNRLIKEKSLSDRIETVGFVDNPYPLIRDSKVMCMPSRWEGFGLAAVEGLALGVPVVCSGAGGLPTIVNDACGKICAAKEQYADEIAKLLLDDEYLAKKSEAATARADELDNYAEYKSLLEKVYCEVK